MTYPPTDPDTVVCTYPVARYVKLSQETTNEQLQMLEVQVMSSGTNIAIGQPASRKCTLLDTNSVPRLAYFAVDNELTTYSSTNCNEPWWVVDLGQSMPIEHVIILNRCDLNGCSCKLSNATISVLDEQSNVVSSTITIYATKRRQKHHPLRPQ